MTLALHMPGEWYPNIVIFFDSYSAAKRKRKKQLGTGNYCIQPIVGLGCRTYWDNRQTDFGIPDFPI